MIASNLDVEVSKISKLYSFSLFIKVIVTKRIIVLLALSLLVHKVN